MGKARKVVLGTRTFDRAGDATKHFGTMLAKYRRGERVTDSDARDLEALLELHDEKSEKIGVGIAYFEVRAPPDLGMKGQCFWIIRTDGTPIDFSFVHCLRPNP